MTRLALPTRRHRSKLRRGSFVVEAAIGVALLATASYALMKLATISSELTRQSDSRLAVTLVAQNALHELKSLEFPVNEEAARAIATRRSADTGCDVTIELAPFENAALTGVHLRVTAVTGEEQSVTLHDWVLSVSDTLSNEDSAAREDSQEASEAAPQPADVTTEPAEGEPSQGEPVDDRTPPSSTPEDAVKEAGNDSA